MVADGRSRLHRRHEHPQGPRASDEPPPHPTRDLHFGSMGRWWRIFEAGATTGPSRRASASRPAWFTRAVTAGETNARVIADGPDEDLDRFTCALHGALAARALGRVVTPYFLPDAAGRRARRGGAAWRHVESAPRAEQPVLRVGGHPARGGAGPWLQGVALAAAVRPLEARHRRRRVDAARLGQLGYPQPAPQLRARRGVLRPAVGARAGRPWLSSGSRPAGG